MNKRKQLSYTRPQQQQEDPIHLHSEKETDRLETQQLPLASMLSHKRNPSQLFVLRECQNLLPTSKEDSEKQQVHPLRSAEPHNENAFYTNLQFDVQEMEEDADTRDTHLAWQGQELSLLPPNFAMIYEKIKSLDLRNNKFTECPAPIFALPNLMVLHLDGNRLKGLPTGLGQLTQLQILTLSKNKLQWLNRALSRLSSLSVLVLSDNALDEWPDWLCTSYPQLRVLHLHGNPRISSLPATLPQLRRLTELSFDWYSYLDSAMNHTLRGSRCLFYIRETGALCQKLNEGSNTSKPVKCTFRDFWRRFKPPSVHRYAKGRTALHLAALWGHATALKELKGECDLNVRDAHHLTPLLLAMRAERLEVVDELLKLSAVDINCRHPKHGTPLHIAVRKGWWPLAERLVSHPGFDVSAKDANGNTVLHLLFAFFEQDSGRIANICTTILQKRPYCINELNGHGMAPLHCAAKLNQRGAFSFALFYNRHQAGPGRPPFDFGVAGGQSQSSVLHLLVLYCEIELVNEVLRAGANPLVEDSQGRTPRDLVRNTIMGRLLKKYELAARRVHLSSFPTQSSLTGREAVNTTSAHIEISRGRKLLHNHLILNRATLSPRVGKLLSPSCQELEGEEFDSPVRLGAYTSAAPVIFADLRKFKLSRPSEGPSRLSDGRLRTQSDCTTTGHDNIKEHIPLHPDSIGHQDVLRDRPVHKSLNNVAVVLNFGSVVDELAKAEAEDSEANVDSSRKSEDIDTERMSGTIFKRPSLVDKQPRERDILAQTCASNFLFQSPPQARLALQNRFAGLLTDIMDSRTPRPQQYRLAYHLFQQYVSDSEETLVLMCERWQKTSAIIHDVVYMLNVMKSRKAVPLLRAWKGCGKGVALCYEAGNAEDCITLKKNCIPVKYESKQCRNDCIRVSLLREPLCQTQVVAGVSQVVNLGGTVEFVRSHTNGHGLVPVCQMPVRKTVNYFTLNHP